MRRRGILDALPLVVPAIPFAFVVGVTILDAGVDPLTGWSSSFIVFAGAAQLTLLSLVGAGAVGAGILAAMVINLRHLLYSLALAPAFQQQPRWFRWVGSALLIDQMFVLGERRRHEPPERFRAYYLSAGVTFLVSWVAFVALGLVLGPAVPTSWGIAFAVPVMFTGMLVAGLVARSGDGRVGHPKVIAAVVAGLVTVLAADLPNRSGLLVGALAGIAAGIAAARVRP